MAGRAGARRVLLDAGAAADDDGPRAAKQRVASTLFVGQLPYHVTAAQVEEHFREAAEGGKISVRLLEKPAAQGGGSRGSWQSR